MVFLAPLTEVSIVAEKNGHDTAFVPAASKLQRSLAIIRCLQAENGKRTKKAKLLKANTRSET